MWEMPAQSSRTYIRMITPGWGPHQGKPYEYAHVRIAGQFFRKQTELVNKDP